ncbi:response regulator transcription factor [Crossiella sp. CA198]|uniref:response regulator transcription factor n=1 Tax=Crossiella sp. CA198 TaxID=3455607 RepID=UPI003F8D4003
MTATSGGYRPTQPSERELQALRMAANGLTNSQIGTRLGITDSAIKARLSRLYRALGVPNRAGAVAEAHRRGLLSAARGDGGSP